MRHLRILLPRKTQTSRRRIRYGYLDRMAKAFAMSSTNLVPLRDWWALCLSISCFVNHFRSGARAEACAFDSVLIDVDAAENGAIPDRLGDAGE